MSDSLQSRALQHARLPCPSPSPGIFSVHWVADAIQPSHPLSSPSPPAFNLSQHQGLFQLVSSFHQVPKDFPQWLHWWTFLPAVHKGSPFSRFSPIVIYCLFDDTVILIGVKRYLTVVCILLFLMIGNIEHLMYMLAICLLWKNIYSYPLPVF